MDVFEITSFIIVGAVVGSFLNVVILRYNTGVGFTRGRSRWPTGIWGTSGLGFMTCKDIYVNIYFIREFCYHCRTNGHTALETPPFPGGRSVWGFVRGRLVGVFPPPFFTAGPTTLFP